MQTSPQSSPSDPGDLGFLWLELTRKCNLRCVHCYADSSPELPLYEEMQFEDWKRTLSEAATLGCRSVQFLGGEATLHPRLERLMEHAVDEGYEYLELYTNATSLTAERLARLVKYNVLLACSFYSHQPEVHDRITGRTGSFHKTVEGIERALSTGLPLRCAVITMELNRDDRDETVEFLHRLGVENLGVDRARGVGRGGNGESVSPAMEDTCGHCANGRLCVTASGEAYPCIMSRCSQVGNVLDSTLAEILPSEEFVEFRELMAARFPKPPRPHGSTSCQPHPHDGPCQPHPHDGPCQPHPHDGPCQPFPEGKEVCQPFPEGKVVCQPFPEGKEICQPFPEGKVVCQPFPEGKEICQPFPQGEGRCQPFPEDEACQAHPRDDGEDEDGPDREDRAT